MRYEKQNVYSTFYLDVNSYILYTLCTSSTVVYSMDKSIRARARATYFMNTNAKISNYKYQKSLYLICIVIESLTFFILTISL